MSNSEKLNATLEDNESRRTSTRLKIVETIWASWALVFVGISDCLLGPSLLDLQALLQTDLAMLNYVVLASGLGDFLGTLLAAVLSGTADINLRLCLPILFGSLSVALCVQVANYLYVLTLFSIHGTLRGIVFCYAVEKTNSIWNKNKGVAFQTTTLGPTVAGIGTTLIIRNFLCAVPFPEKAFESNIEQFSNSSSLDSALNSSRGMNPSNWTLNTTTGDVTEQCNPADVRISAAYNILGAFNLPLSIIYFVYWWTGKPKREAEQKIRSVGENDTKLEIGHRLTLPLSVLFVLFYFFILGGNIMYATYLTEFGVMGPLHMDKQTMVLMTSMYWGTSLLGRVFGIFLAPVLGIEKLMITYLVLLLVSLTTLVFTVAHSEIILWICTGGVGLFIGIYVGTGYGWYASVMTLRSRVISASSASLGLGGMAIPFLGGVLFQAFGALAFIYCLYSIYIFTASVFAILIVVSRRVKHANLEREMKDPVCDALKTNFIP